MVLGAGTPLEGFLAHVGVEICAAGRCGPIADKLQIRFPMAKLWIICLLPKE